jgi:hypothetical protein
MTFAILFALPNQMLSLFGWILKNMISLSILRFGLRLQKTELSILREGHGKNLCKCKLIDEIKPTKYNNFDYIRNDSST